MLATRTRSRTAHLRAMGLRRTYQDVVAVDRVDLDVLPGEIHALVGLNGAGKTTVMRMLLGMTRPDTGTVALHGRDIRTGSGAGWGRVGHLIETPFACRADGHRERRGVSATPRSVAPISWNR